MIARRFMVGWSTVLLSTVLLVAALVAGTPAFAQDPAPAGASSVAKRPIGESGLVDPSQMPGPLKEVRFDQNLGALLPLDARFVDADGQNVVLGDLFGKRPVVLVFVYYECPMLCTLILNGLAKSLNVIKLDPGEDFDVIALSFDPGETPALAQAAKARTIDRYGREGTDAGWHFLTGSEAEIARVSDAAGFQFVYDPDSDEYAHTSGIVVVRPDGTINQYYYGIEYPPRDVRLSLIDAAEHRAGSVVDQLLLYCFRFDPQLGKYTMATMRVLRVAGVVFTIGMASFLLLMWRLERRAAARILKQPQPPPVGAA